MMVERSTVPVKHFSLFYFATGVSPPSCTMHIIFLYISTFIPDYTSGKNHFHEMNGDVGMAGRKKNIWNKNNSSY